MGKIALIMIFSIIIVFSAIMVSVHHSSSSIPEKVAATESEMLGEKLGNYAISYSIKKLVDGNVSLSPDDRVSYGYDDFEIFDGKIDSIIYQTNSTLDTVTVYAKTTYEVVNQYSSNYRSAKLRINSSSTSNDFDNAITSAGTVSLKGHAYVVGGVEENQHFTFLDVFGTSPGDIKNAAKELGSYYKNPSNHQTIGDSITWMQGDFHPTSWWNGSGILIVNGDFKMTAHSEFDGILYVTGSFMMTAHSDIRGTVFIQDKGKSKLRAHSRVIYDEDLIDDDMDAISSGRSYELLSLE